MMAVFVRTPLGWSGPARILWLAALVITPVGCSNTIRIQDSPENPVSLVMVDHGRHPSLMIPEGEGGIRYTWGEWRWYAHNEIGVLRGLNAVFWPTQATLGRYHFEQWPERGASAYIIPEGYRELLILEVEQEKARSLKDRLDGVFEEGAEQARVYNPVYRLEFVPLEENYWVFNQSNQRMISWLRELGLEVRGPGLYSNWRLIEDDTE